jgi:uncharacterized protein YbjT (DUF2867 family)
VSTDKQVVLVTGATGKQGGAVARHLRACGFRVRALTRDPSSEKAQPLLQMGVEVVQGDTTDAASLEKAVEGVWGVFSMATPFKAGMEAEVTQGKTLGDAAKAAGVQHYVYSSVGGADRDSKVPHFETKWAIENHLRSLGLPLTIIRPVYFFENFVGGWAMQKTDEGYALAAPLSPGRTLQGVAVDDIGAFVALVFGEPGRWAGQEFELAGDEMTGPRYCEAMSRDLGRPVRYQQIPWEAVRAQSEDGYRTFDFFEREGYKADIAKLRETYAGLQNFAQWLERGGLRPLKEQA